MKKRSCILISSLLLLLVFAFAPTSFADVYVEPTDYFHKDHADECTRVDRFYITNGADGKVTFYENPESAFTVAQVDNNTRVPMMLSYTDSEGTAWFYASLRKISTQAYGWCRASDVYEEPDDNAETASETSPEDTAEDPSPMVAAVGAVAAVAVISILLLWKLRRGSRK